MKSTVFIMFSATILASCATEPYLLRAPEKYNASVSADCRIDVENANFEVGGRVEPSVPSLAQVMRVEACSRPALVNIPITFHVEEATCLFGRRIGLGAPAVRSHLELTYTTNGNRSDALSDTAQVDGTGRQLCDITFWPLVITVIDQVEQSIQESNGS